MLVLNISKDISTDMSFLFCSQNRRPVIFCLFLAGRNPGTNILSVCCMPGRRLRKIILMIKSAKDVINMPLKTSYKSGSTRHLYEFADEIAPAAADKSAPKTENRRQKP